MTPYIYGIYVKRDLPYYILLNFAEKGKNLLFILYIFVIMFENIFFEFYSLILFFWDGLYAQIKKVIQNFKGISSENKFPSFPDTSSIPEATT